MLATVAVENQLTLLGRLSELIYLYPTLKLVLGKENAVGDESIRFQTVNRFYKFKNYSVLC